MIQIAFRSKMIVAKLTPEGFHVIRHVLSQTGKVRKTFATLFTRMRFFIRVTREMRDHLLFATVFLITNVATQFIEMFMSFANFRFDFFRKGFPINVYLFLVLGMGQEMPF